MKNWIKVLSCIVVAIAMACPVQVFAEEVTPGIRIGGWGRVVFVPAISNRNGEVVPIETTSWGWGDGRIGFTISGVSEQVGFQADINVDSGSVGTHDQHKVWAKLMDGKLTVELGATAWYDTLRGNSAFGAWNWFRPLGIGGEDNIFLRTVAGRNMGPANAVGGAIIHYDANGLHTFAALSVVENSDRENYTTAMMLERGQYGFGYEIENFGLARVQYIGKSYDKDPMSDELESYGVINGALRIDKAIEKLYLDVGAFVPTDTDVENVKVAAYANYQMSDVMKTHLLVEAELDKADATGKEGTGLSAGLGVDYGLGNGLDLKFDFRFNNETSVATAGVDNQLAFLAGITKFIGNGVIGIGVQGTTWEFAGGDNVTKEKVDDFSWAVPVTVEYWF